MPDLKTEEGQKEAALEIIEIARKIRRERKAKAVVVFTVIDGKEMGTDFVAISGDSCEDGFNREDLAEAMASLAIRILVKAEADAKEIKH